MIYLPAYYANLRRLHRLEPGARIARVALGTNSEADAAAITNGWSKPITALEDDPDDPRVLRVRYAVARGEAPTGMIVREIGLLTQDGALIVRRTFTHGIEVTPDLAIDDVFLLEV